MDGCSCEQIISLLETKSMLKQSVYQNTLKVFEEIKEILHEVNGDINDMLSSTKRIKVEYRDRGKFEAQIQVATDMLIFTMHTNVFQFSADHEVLQTEYVAKNSNNSYCGVINIYDFLADSFKYNRQYDDGYLLGRIFVNHENKFFVEGKNQEKYNFESFGKASINSLNLKEILFDTITYALEFDLLVPQFDEVKIIGVEQMNTRLENSRIATAKLLGREYNCDDI